MDKCFVLAFACVTLLIATISATNVTNVGEEASCYHDLFKGCHENCSDYLPADKKAEIQSCVHRFGDSNYHGIKGCLRKKGITDDKPCFKKPGHGALKNLAGANQVGNFETMKDYLLCTTACIKGKQPPCDYGCPKPDKSTRTAMKTCIGDALKSNDGPFSCLFKAITGKEANIPPQNS